MLLPDDHAGFLPVNALDGLLVLETGLLDLGIVLHDVGVVRPLEFLKRWKDVSGEDGQLEQTGAWNRTHADALEVLCKSVVEVDNLLGSCLCVLRCDFG